MTPVIPSPMVPSPTIAVPAVPSPTVVVPTIPNPTIPQPAIVQPTIPTPRIPAPATRAEVVPPDGRALFLSVVEQDIQGRCFRDVNLGRGPALPGQRASEPAAAPRRAPATRVVIAVDASGSMAGRAGTESKMEAARRAARRFLDTLGPEVEVGLVVFGHRGNARNDGRAASCSSAEAMVPLSARGRDAAAAALDRLRPMGWTPLAAAMEAAARQFRPSDREGEQLLVVISDGVETCGGDPVAVARRLNTGELRVVVDIVGFDIAERERAALQAVARAGGGDFANVTNQAAVNEALRRSREGTLNALAAARAQTSAAIAAGRTQTNANLAVARAQSCVNLALLREQTGLNIGLSRGPSQVRPAPAVADEARGLLAERHRVILTSLDAYVAGVRGVRDARLEQIERDLTEALKPSAR